MRIGSVVYATSQGLGHLAKSFFDAGVLDEVMVFQHPHGEAEKPTRMDWYPEGTPKLVTRPFQGPAVNAFLERVDVVLFFETPFDWSFVNLCRQQGVKTALMPMYEWYPERPPYQVDLFLNPSLLDQRYFPGGRYLPVPVEQDIIDRGELRQYGVRFLHNAGNIGSRNHKGTLELLKALPLLPEAIDLTIRCQNGPGLKRLLASAGINPAQYPNLHLVDREIPREELFSSEYDIYIAPEKYNGLSLPLQEAYASGMVVMTTNRFPTNCWLPHHPLIPVSETHRVHAAPGHLEIEESIVSPEDIADTITRFAGTRIQDLSQQGLHYAQRHSWSILKPAWMDALRSLV